MLKFKAVLGSKPLLGIGLSSKNLEKLQAGQPILFDAKELGFDGSVFIFFGNTEQEMADDLVKNGMVSSGTVVHPDVNSH